MVQHQAAEVLRPNQEREGTRLQKAQELEFVKFRVHDVDEAAPREQSAGGLHGALDLGVVVAEGQGLLGVGAEAAVRRAQLDALAPVLERARSSGDDVILVGDFNATGPDDLVAIDACASRVGLYFATRDVECSSYWNRSDGCLGVPLDHVLTSWSGRAFADGPCRTEGCAMRETCPVFHREVSDHCPVIVDR